MSGLAGFTKELSALADKKQAQVLQGFFKTGPGQYGEGDIFLGIKVPRTRLIAKKYLQLSLSEIQSLLNSSIHEYRLGALFILIAQYKVADDALKKKIFNFYLKNTRRINNWDLVDLSAPNIVGDYLLDRDRQVLYRLAGSKDLWGRRISIIATFAFIRNNDFNDTLKIAKTLIADPHDLIHKAVGWMLREVGKRELKVEEAFLNRYAAKMPRTMLRYAIEKFSDQKRKYYLTRK
ncbi:MAG: DNA alkylation repair protein [Candidatus Buchananbacteria bacterium]|nr:DNA alkylation repair protein [Candidatus Buchananbacteria bacterium]